MMTEVKEEVQQTGQALTGAGMVSPIPTKDKRSIFKRMFKKQDPRDKDRKRFTKKKSRKWKAVILLVVLAGGGFGWYQMKNSGPTGIMVETTPLQRGELVSSVNLSGTLQSGNEMQVYPATTGMVKLVNVKVGDQVEAGDVLAQLDTDGIQISIAKQQAVINQGLKKNEYNESLLEKDFDAARVDMAAGLNQQALSAQSALDRAQQNLNAARRDFNEHKQDRELSDAMFNDAHRKLERAQTAKRKADVAYEDALNNPNVSAERREELKKQLDQAEEEYQQARDNYNYVDKEYGGSMTSEARALREARIDYENALDSQRATENALDRELDSLKDKIIGQQIDNDMTLEYLNLQQLQQDLADSTIVSPISGTVTAVYAKEGAPASGLMFVVEDTDNLLIKTSLREFEVGTVLEGMKAIIKADATGEKEFTGEVEKIYPTAKKNENGETNTSGSIEFETDVALTGSNEGLRVGMNVRVNIETAKKDNVLIVPFDAVSTDAQGNNIVYVVRNGEGEEEAGRQFAKAVPVTIGMETDFSVEISGEGIEEGMEIITSSMVPLSEGMEIRTAGMPAAGADMGMAAQTAADGTQGTSMDTASSEAPDAASGTSSSESSDAASDALSSEAQDADTGSDASASADEG